MEKLMWGYRGKEAGEKSWAIWVEENEEITVLGEPPEEEMEKARNAILRWNTNF